MTVGSIRLRFSSKTLAIAVASSVIIGGGVVVPEASATAGYEGAQFIPDYEKAYAENPGLDDKGEEELQKIAQKYPKANRTEDIPVWGLQGGYYPDVKVQEGTAGGFAGRASSGMLAPHGSGYGPALNLLSVMNKYQGIDRELSVDVKKVLFVTFSLVNDVQKNNGLSPTAKAKLSAAGYTGDYGKVRVLEGGGLLGESRFFDSRPQESELLIDSKGNFYADGITPFTPGDTLAETAAIVSGAAMSADTSYKDPETYSAPASFDDISTDFSEYIMNSDHGFLEADPSLGEAIINIAREVTTEDLNKVDLKIRFSEDVPVDAGITFEAVYNPVFFDITNSTPASIEDLLPDTDNSTNDTDTDIYVDKVEKLDNGDYEVTRNDGKTWTIAVSELQNQIDGLDSQLAETVKNVENLKDTTASKEEVAKLQQDLEKHTEQLADHEARLTELEANGANPDDSAAVEKEIAENKAVIKDLSEKLDSISPRLDGVEKGVADNTARIDGLKKDFDTAIGSLDKDRAEIADLRKQVEKNTAEIADLKAKDNAAKFESKIAELEKENADLESQIKTLKSEVSERFDKVTERMTVLETRADETKKSLDGLDKRVSVTETDIQQVKVDILSLGKRIDAVEIKITELSTRIESLESDVKTLQESNKQLQESNKQLQESNKQQQESTQCYATMSKVSLIAALVAPLIALGSGGNSQANVTIQKQLGIYNSDLAKMMADNEGIIKALGAVAALAAGLGILGYVNDKCGSTESVFDFGLRD